MDFPLFYFYKKVVQKKQHIKSEDPFFNRILQITLQKTVKNLSKTVDISKQQE